MREGFPFRESPRLPAIMVHVHSAKGAAAQNAWRAARRKIHLRNMRNLLHSYRQGFQSLQEQRGRAEEQRHRAEEELRQTFTTVEAQATAALHRTEMQHSSSTMRMHFPGMAPTLASAARSVACSRVRFR